MITAPVGDSPGRGRGGAGGVGPAMSGDAGGDEGVVISELKAVAAEHPELSALLASYGVKLPGTATEA